MHFKTNLQLTILDLQLQDWVVNCELWVGSCKLEVVIWEVGVRVGWCNLGDWNTKLELQSSSCGDC